MIRFSRIYLKKWAHITISGIKCSYYNIRMLFNTFPFEFVILTIDSVPAESPLISLVKDKGLEYIISQDTTDLIEISIKVPYSLFDLVLKTASREYPENLFVFKLVCLFNWKDLLHSSLAIMIKKGVLDFFISIALDENALSIYVNKAFISPKELYKRLRILHFE